MDSITKQYAEHQAGRGSLDRLVSLQDCLEEINNALNYWYPLKPDADEEECNARHVRLFEFRDRLERQLKANARDMPRR